MLIYLIRGGMEWSLRTLSSRKAIILQIDDSKDIIHRIEKYLYIAVGGLILLPANLMFWGVYETLESATKGVLTFGFKVGAQKISIGLVILSVGIIYGSLLISWIIQRLLMEEVLFKRRMSRGVRASIGRLIHYAIIVAGFLIALSTLGLELTKLVIMFSALGVGIGFGLQGIVNNFISGLILLFEQPVRVGDVIELGGQWAEIRKIGLRSTIIKTYDEAEIIIPNSDLITNQVTNWTLTDKKARIIIPVGVAYGSNISLVMEKLMAAAEANKRVANYPNPHVLFMSFGESSLDFELRVWVIDGDYRLIVKSELHQEIDRLFREANIEIAFPQRDLHLRSVDEQVNLNKLQEDNKD
jgi:small-conductance mechanosensitive channel